MQILANKQNEGEIVTVHYSAIPFRMLSEGDGGVVDGYLLTFTEIGGSSAI